ncbi:MULTISPECIES: ABC transporter substrate-binding protein [Clostridium]|uniref:ABC transporter substrate-binding protein n=1 Tax=Clostridium TaxID=1485 RepID=UPI0006E6A9EF|nr:MULTISPECIES: ABC transporter substrate-binding protein [Clostridium]KQB77957.1 ABC transporter substrate-binding protein [Clostridium butyricum]MBO1686374.1 carbohydrate ABC transporter substrate-binding protein [Clostridium butyricum]MBS4842277.1 carbohydrate ABC transporter substrate-binding protein [Clostridium sp.]MCQ2015735.1 ABC transporter substrate-binding protein [Clostridium butyricum]MCQ2019830.1 ABC transporter substrate-binding protein [Clostridium butyricum]
MKKKKLLATVLASALACGTLSGCGGTAQTSGSATSSDGSGKTVKVFQLKVEINDALQKLAQEYEKEKGVKVEITSVGGGADYGASLKAEFQKGTEPDIFMVAGKGDYEIWKHKIDDLSDQPWISNAVKGTLDTVTIDGKTYGMPAATEGYGLMYNKDILDKAGIDPKTITSFDALKAAFETLDSKKAELGLENVVSYTTKETWVTGNHTFNIPFAAQEDPDKFLDEYVAGKADIVNNKEFNDWMNLVGLLCKYGGGKSLETIDYSNQVGNFALEKTAFIQQGNWVASDLNSLGANFNMGFIPMCLNNDANDKANTSIPVGVPMYWVVNKDSAVNKEAKEFLDWMVESQTGQEALVKDMNMIPAFTNFKAESSNPLNKSITEYNNSGNTLKWAFTNFPDGFTMNDIGPVFSKFLNTDMGDAAKKEMLQNIQDASPKQAK